MSHATRAPRVSLWRRRAALATIPAVLLALLTSVVSTQAAVDSPFDIDGTVPDAGATLFDDPSLATAELGPKNGSTTKLGVIHSAPKPMLALTNPNGQVDIDKIWLQTTTDAVTNDSWLYFAFQRDAATGSGALMYEFQFADEPVSCDYSGSDATLIANCNPWENRAPGDFVLVFDQQGSTVTIYLRYFTDATPATPFVKGDKLTLGPVTNLTTANLAEAAMSANGFYGEAAVNLTDTIFSGAPAGCLTVGNVIPGTVTGNSDTADYKDTVLANFADAVSISNCGSVKIVKETDPDGLSGTFPYAVERSGGQAIRFPADGGGTTATGTLTEDGDFEIQEDLIAAGNYTLSEGDVGPEFALTDITCVRGTGASTVTVNVYPDGDDFAVAVGQQTTCTITNQQQRGTLIVQKVLINDNGGTKGYGDFSWSVDGAAATPFVDGNEVSTSVLAGTYTITEPEANTMGYTTTYSGCEDMVITVGGSAKCTITNDDDAPTLLVRKVIVNDNGGSADFGDFSWTVDDGAATAFVDGTAVDTGVTQAGTYTVTEPEADSAAYSTTYGDDCTNVVLALGETKTCVITNNDNPGTLKVKKVLINDNGGSAGYGDFSWSLDGAAGVAFEDGDFVEMTVDAGTYAITEPEANTMGYTTTYSEDCDNLVVANGGSAECTITNDDTKASPTGTTVQHWVLHDSLALAGLRLGAPDAGSQTATFRLYSDASCETQVGDDETVSVSSGAAATVDGVTVYDTGSYYWTVEFNGDQYNNGFTTGCGDEITQISAKDNKDGGRNDLPV